MVSVWLLTYNILAFLAWLFFLLSVSHYDLTLNKQVLWLLNIAQILAVFEIIHVALKWVKSPLLTTILQVSSRLIILLFINIIPTEQLGSIGWMGFRLVALAWGITEVIRYAYYATLLKNKVPKLILWLRYTLFIILYPTGVTGEMLIVYRYAELGGWQISIVNVLLVGLVLSYVVFFPKLYMYMWKQRKIKLKPEDEEE